MAASTLGPNCWATIRATNRLPRTPPFVLRNAVILPILMASMIDGGTSARTKIVLPFCRTTVGLSPNLTEGGCFPLSSLMLSPSWRTGHSSGIFQKERKKGLVDFWRQWVTWKRCALRFLLQFQQCVGVPGAIAQTTTHPKQPSSRPWQSLQIVPDVSSSLPQLPRRTWNWPPITCFTLVLWTHQTFHGVSLSGSTHPVQAGATTSVGSRRKSSTHRGEMLP